VVVTAHDPRAEAGRLPTVTEARWPSVSAVIVAGSP
jgi:hypothetical protein